jgi:putative peptidoglycan lipid II flippase
LISKFGIAAFAYGVVIGSALNFFIQVPALINTGLRYWPTLDFRNKGFQQALVLMVPVLIGLSVTQFNLFVSQNLASGLTAGSITALKIAQRLMQMPLGIFAMSIAMAVFPIMTAQAAKGEHDDLKRTLSVGLRAIIFITLPATAGLIAIGQPTIRLMFEWKSFSAANTLATSQALVYYSLGLTAYSALQILNRAYYAMKNTLTPVTVGVITILLNIYLSYKLVQPLTHLGLALAYSLAGLFNATALLIILRWRLGPIDGRKILSCLGLSTMISLLMWGLVKGWIHLMPGWLSWDARIEEMLAVLSGILLGAGFYAGMSLWLGMDEAIMVKTMLARRFPDFWNRLARS